MGGGIIVLPGLHDLLRVNMKTMTITVDGGDGLITKDSRRVDAAAQFFIRVAPNADAIARAAQSLGQNTNDLDAIRSLLEGKVQDTMRAITAGMDLIELHQSRASFVQKVQQTLNNDLSPNGLELESVALTKLDETPIGKLDENNTFDVTGLRVRAAIVSEQKKQRVSIEESAALEIARTLQANRIQKLEVERAEAEATQKQRIAVSELEATAAREAARIAEETNGCAKSRGSSANAACAKRPSSKSKPFKLPSRNRRPTWRCNRKSKAVPRRRPQSRAQRPLPPKKPPIPRV
jgi:flotillin